MLEKRKVGRLGASSLVVSLPAEWVRLTGIRKGDEVYAYDQGLSLVITPRERKPRSRVAEVELKDAHGAAVEVFARYVQGFDSIRVVNKASQASRAELDQLLRAVDFHLLGVQVISQSRDGVTLQVFARSDASLPRLFKRLRFVVKSFSALLTQELRSKSFDSSQITVLMKSAFKLYFLVLRMVYGAPRGSRALAQSKLSFSELLSFALAAKNIGGLLDSLNKLVKAYDDLGEPFKQDGELVALVDSAAELYLNCLTAFLQKEKIDFGSVRRKRRDLLVAINSLSAERKRLPSAKQERVVRDTELIGYEFADKASELMELAANVEGVE